MSTSTRTLTRSERLAVIDMIVPNDDTEFVALMFASMALLPDTLAAGVALATIDLALQYEQAGLPITAPTLEDFYLDFPEDGDDDRMI